MPSTLCASRSVRPRAGAGPAWAPALPSSPGPGSRAGCWPVLLRGAWARALGQVSGVTRGSGAASRRVPREAQTCGAGGRVRGRRACRCLMRTSSPCVPFCSVKAVTLPSKQLARPPRQSKGVPRRAVPACAGLPSGAHLLRPTLLGAAPHVAGSCAWFNGPGKGSFSPSQPAACVTALTFISATLIGWHV